MYVKFYTAGSVIWKIQDRKDEEIWQGQGPEV